jgi:protein-disulfide isomerase
MTDNQLSGKELYEQQKREREQARGSNQPSAKPKSGSKIWPWIVTILVLAAVVLGVYKLATSTPPGGVAASGTLSQPVSAADHTRGSATAPVQLVEYADFQCPACGYFAPWVERLSEESGADLAVTFRHFPLRQIHNNAQLAAQIVEAAGKQGKFWEASKIVFANQSKWSDLVDPSPSLYSLLININGLNIDKLKVDMKNDSVKEKIDADYASGIASGVDGTPSFFLNGKRIENPKSYADFRQLVIDATGKPAITTNASSTQQ